MTLVTKTVFTKPRNIRRVLLLLGSALLTTATPAMAENRDGAFTLSPFAGGQGFPFGGETHYDGDFNWGARAGYNITRNWRAELVFGVNDTVHDPEAAICRIYQYGADIFCMPSGPTKTLYPSCQLASAPLT
jgi:OOP family OmpA-OmpF porin